MKRKLFFWVFVLSLFGFSSLMAQTNAPNAGQTYFYRQTGIVTNGNRTTGDNTGQFITFTRAGCYDSNRDGRGSDDDFHRYIGFNDNRTMHVYEGNSYWGTALYLFSTDFSRLNIRAENGIFYVYEKIIAPDGVLTSAYFYRRPEPPRREEVVIVPPVIGRVEPVNNEGITPPPPPPDHTAELQRLKARYNQLRANKERQEQLLRDSYQPVVDSGIARGYFDNRNSIRETIRLYERQMADIQREARNLGGSVY
jgi:hypothetical protein